MTQFFYFAAQTYRGAMYMGSTCKSARQAFDAFLKGEVYLARGVIRSNHGNYSSCMKYSQTGTLFNYYMGAFQAYMQ